MIIPAALKGAQLTGGQAASNPALTAQSIWDHTVGDGVTARSALLGSYQSLLNNCTIVAQSDGSQLVTIFEADGTTAAFQLTITSDGLMRTRQ